MVSLHLHDAIETLSADRGGVRVSCKLELLIVQLRQVARFKLASQLRRIQHAKSAFGGPNARLPKLAPLKLHSPDVKHKKRAPMSVKPSSPLSLKRLCSDAPISNATVAHLLSRDAGHVS